MHNFIISAVTLCVVGSHAHGQIAPAFTVGRNGPSALPTDVLLQIAGAPTPFAGGSSSGLVSADAINGFSQRELINTFLFCFSVDQASTGIPGLAPVISSSFPNAPFNVTDQATKGQAAGSAFLSTKAFNRAGMLPVLPSMSDFNNVLAINQSPAYPNDFGLLPLFSPNVNTGGAPMDDVEGGGSAGALAAGGPLFLTLEQPN